MARRILRRTIVQMTRAALRRELHDPKTPVRRRKALYGELIRRRT